MVHHTSGMTNNEVNVSAEEQFPTPGVEYEYVWIKSNLFYAVLAVDGLELLSCIFYMAAIILFRKHLTFSNAGFFVNLLFTLGCAMILLSIPLFGTDTKLIPAINISDACMARVWLLSVGFTLGVGALIVRVIYTSFCEAVYDSKSSLVPSWILKFSVILMATIDTIVVLAWRFSSPPHKEYVKKKVELIGLQDERVTLVESCSSEKESLLVAFLCFYKGGLLLVAVMFSLPRRKDEETSDDDLKQCRVGLLSVLITGLIAVPVVLSLPLNPNTSFAVGGLLTILETAFLTFWIIGRKIVKVYSCKKGAALEFGKYSVQRETRCIPCVRAMYGCVYNGKRQGFYNASFADFDSTSDVQDPDLVVLEKNFDDRKSAGVGFDGKESEDVLPKDLKSFNEINMKPYDPHEAEKEEEEGEEEEEEEEEGEQEDSSSETGEESSEEDGTSSDDDDDDNDGKGDSKSKIGEGGSKTTVRTAASVYIGKSSRAGTTTRENEEQSAASGDKGNSSGRAWWRPIFGFSLLKGSKKNNSSQVNTESETSGSRRFSRAESGKTGPCSSSSSESSTESESNVDDDDEEK